jgi:hypothetical protein
MKGYGKITLNLPQHTRRFTTFSSTINTKNLIHQKKPTGRISVGKIYSQGDTMSDAVIEQIEEMLLKGGGTLAFLEKKKTEVEAGMFSSAGDVRSSVSQQVALRIVEIEGIKKRLENLEGSLRYAKEDLPRRVAERKAAEELELKALEKDRVAASLVEQLRQVEKQAYDLRVLKNAALTRSSATAKELELRAKEEVEAREKKKHDNISFAAMALRSAELALSSAMKAGNHPILIAERQGLRDRAASTLEKLEKESANV